MLHAKRLVALLAVAGLLIAVAGGPPALALSGSRWKLESLWFFMVLVLVTPPISRVLANSWDYVLALVLVGGPLALATLAHQFSLPSGQMCLHCVVGDGMALAITAMSLCSPAHATPLSSRLRMDFSSLWTGRGAIVITALLAISWAGISAAESVRIDRWLSGSERVAELATHGHGTRVTVFSDFQCPACAAKHQSYDPVLDTLAESSDGRIVVERLDFPLDSECNPQIDALVHPAACEAAVLARIAKGQGIGRQVATYLYEHHGQLTSDSVRAYATQLGMASEYESKYSSVVTLIRQDIEIAARVGIQGTPTYFVNGIRIDNSLTPAMLAAVVRAASGS
jgi:predicted DsbA family dithiol-disulfide isomerase